jgi:hypothetical protein
MGLLGNCSLDYENYHCDSCAETGANASATCTDMFGFDSGSYWSSSPYGASADRAWYSSFNGYVLGDEKTIVHDIRCVRSGP